MSIQYVRKWRRHFRNGRTDIYHEDPAGLAHGYENNTTGRTDIRNYNEVNYCLTQLYGGEIYV